MTVLTNDDLRRRAAASQDLPTPAARRAIRIAAGVTIPEMAAVVGVTRQAVDLWESGQRTPRGEHLERYVAALREMDEVRVRLDELSARTATAKIGVDDTSTRRQLSDIENALNAVANETLRVRPLDLGDLERLNGEVDTLEGKLRDVNDRLDSTTRSADETTKSLSGGRGSGGGLLGAALALTPALGTVGAVGVAGLGGLVTAAGAATLGMGAFALAAEGSLSQVKTQAETLLTTWQGTTNAFTSPVIHDAVGLLPGVFHLLTPEVALTSQALHGLEGDIRTSLGSPYLNQFADFIGGQGSASITAFGHLLGGLGHALSGVAIGLAPLLTNLEGDLTRWGADLTHVGNEAANGGLTQFMDYVRQNGPLVAHTFEQIGSDLVVLAKDGAPVGPVMLNVLDVAARLVGDLENLNPELTTWAIGLGSVAFTANRLLSPLGGLTGVAPKLAEAWGAYAAPALALGAVNVGNLAIGATAASGTLTTLAAGAVAVIPGLDLLGAAALNQTGIFDNFSNHITAAGKAGIEDFVNALPEGSDKVGAINGEISILTATTGTYGNLAGQVADNLGKFGATVDDLPPKLAGLKQALLNDGYQPNQELTGVYQDLTDKVIPNYTVKIGGLQSVLKGLTQTENTQTDAVKAANVTLGQFATDAAPALSVAALNTADLSGALTGLQTADSNTAASLNQVVAGLNALAGNSLTADQAVASAQSTINNLGTALTSVHGKLYDTSVGTADARSQLDQFAESIYSQVIPSLRANGDSAQTMSNILNNQVVGAFNAMAAKAGYSTSQIADLDSKFKLTRGDMANAITIAVNDSQVLTAQQAADRLVASLTAIKNGNWQAAVQINIGETYTAPTAATPPTRVSAHASGLAMGAMGAHDALVGEKGRELMLTPDGKVSMLGDHGAAISHVPAGAAILTADQTAALPSHAGGLAGLLGDSAGISLTVPAPVFSPTPNIALRYEAQ